MKVEELVKLLSMDSRKLTEKEQDSIQEIIIDAMEKCDYDFVKKLVAQVEHDDIALDNLMTWADAACSGPFEIESKNCFAWSFVIGGTMWLPESDTVFRIHENFVMDREIAERFESLGFKVHITPFLYDAYLKTDEIFSPGNFEEVANSMDEVFEGSGDAPPNERDKRQPSDEEPFPVNLVMILTHEDPDAEPWAVIEQLDEDISGKVYPVSYKIGNDVFNVSFSTSYIGFPVSAFRENPYHADTENFLERVETIVKTLPNVETDFDIEKEGEGYVVHVDFNDDGETITRFESDIVMQPELLKENLEAIVQVVKHEQVSSSKRDPFANCSKTIH